MSVVRIGLYAAILALSPLTAQAQIFSSGSGSSGGGGDARAGAKAFASDCTACHRSSSGLAKNTGASGLVSFLRQHYTTSAQRRGDIAAYILSSGGQSGQAQLRRGRDGAAPEIAGQGEAKPEHARANRRDAAAARANQRQGQAEAAGNQPQAGAEDPAQQLDKRAAARAERQKRRAQREAAKQEAAKQEAAKQEAAKQEALKQQAAREEAERQEAERQEAARQEAARQEAARQEAARQEAARQEAARQEAARQEATRQEAARQEAARQVAARQEAAREAAQRDADEPEQLGFPQGRRMFSETSPDGDRDRSDDEPSVRVESKDGGESSLISSTIKAPEPAFGARAGVRSRLNISGGAARATDAPEGAFAR